MKLSLAIVLILILLTLSTGAETSDNSASRTVTAVKDTPLLSTCKGKDETCSDDDDCCGSLCCFRVYGCQLAYMPCLP
uniref:Conotoxin n=1 Tax=Conus praecellens TaxID=128530 RepID=A0A291C2C8_CONPC|nr:conotoxin [Conus praecellens]